jgi:PPOX class probable F420-dependent enzyme
MQSSIAAFLETVPIGVLATRRPDGTIRQSAVYFVLHADLDGDAVFISTERRRAKAQDIARTGHASLCVVGGTPPYPSVTVEGRARILDSAVAETTAWIFARMSGGTPPPLTDDELAARGRVLVRLDVDRVYGASYLPDDATQQ